MGPEGRGYVPPEAMASPEPETEKEEEKTVETGPAPEVPESEMDFSFSTSGGPGGQNVNKVNSKATVRWHVGNSKAYTEAQKQLIREYASQHLIDSDELKIDSSEQRSQHQNRRSVTESLRNVVAAALVPKIERKATKPSRGQKEARLREKKHRSELHNQRKEGKKAERSGSDDY